MSRDIRDITEDIRDITEDTATDMLTGLTLTCIGLIRTDITHTDTTAIANETTKKEIF
jgi:hypothetical protein